jgi:hypothetical protein
MAGLHGYMARNGQNKDSTNRKKQKTKTTTTTKKKKQELTVGAKGMVIG